MVLRLSELKPLRSHLKRLGGGQLSQKMTPGMQILVLLSASAAVATVCTDRPCGGSHSSKLRIAPKLKQPTRAVDAKRTCPLARARRPYSALLRVGFAMRAALPKPRCALTAPFHPCLDLQAGHRRFALCGTFPRPPSEDSDRAGVTRHPCFVEPGLSSYLAARGCPAPWRYAR